MGQVTLFLIFIITLIVGIYAYLTPVQKSMSRMVYVPDNSRGLDSENEVISSTQLQQVHMTTENGILNISGLDDALTQDQNKLEETINDEQRQLADADKEILDINKKALKTDADILRLKALGAQMQDNQRLLVDHGRALVALNNEINKKRKLLSQKNALERMQDDDQASSLIDKVKDQNDDAVQRSRDLIEDQKQRMEDQESARN